MANVPYDEGVPDVTPRESLPDDFQHEQATPAETGGLIAQGIEKLGQGGSTAAKFFGQVQTDDATNSALTEANKQLNNFRSLRGADALHAQESTQDAIDAAFKSGRDSLSTPEQQYQYDNTVRSYQQRYISGVMASHADEQAKVYAAKVNSDAFTTAVNSVAGVADKPDMVGAFQHDARAAAVRQLQVDGLESDPAAVKAAIAKADQAVAKAQIQAISVNDPLRAQRMVENYKDILGVDYEPMAGSVRQRAETQNGLTAAKDETQKSYEANVPSTVPASLPEIQGALFQQESGNRDNVRPSVTGAVGPGQIEPATFRQYAQPGEDINNPKDNRAVQNRIVADYYQRFNGDPYRVAVAYFSGPGNVAPAGSPTPWINNKSDPTGKSVAAYVGDVAQRLGAPVGPYAMRDAAYRGIMTRTDLNENEKRIAFTDISRNFAEAQVAAEADAKAKKDANDTAMSDYVRQMLTPGGATPDLIQKMQNDPRLEGGTLENLYTFAATKGGLDDPAQYGKAYADTYARILLPPGDPNRINDANDILKLGLPGGGLSGAGVQKSLQIFAQSRKDPDQASVNQVKSSLIQYAKSKLSFDQEMLFPGVKPMADPKGVQIFNAQFIPKFEAAYDAWVGKGNSPWEFLTQENIDKLMTGMRPRAQMAMDRVSAQGEVTGETQQPQPTPQAPQGVEDKTWQNVMATRPVLDNQQVMPPQHWANVLGVLRRDPATLAQFNIPQNLSEADAISYFNKDFPGFDGAEILKKIGATPQTSIAETQPVTSGVIPVSAVIPASNRSATDQPAAPSSGAAVAEPSSGVAPFFGPDQAAIPPEEIARLDEQARTEEEQRAKARADQAALVASRLQTERDARRAFAGIGQGPPLGPEALEAIANEAKARAAAARERLDQLALMEQRLQREKSLQVAGHRVAAGVPGFGHTPAYINAELERIARERAALSGVR